MLPCVLLARTREDGGVDQHPALRQVHALQASGECTVPIEQNGEVDCTLGQISSTFNLQSFCNRLISAVKIATTFRDDVDEQEDVRKAAGVIITDRHSKVNPEELSRKWNIGLQTAKDIMNVTTQRAFCS
jgi:hypothetical protein